MEEASALTSYTVLIITKPTLISAMWLIEHSFEQEAGIDGLNSKTHMKILLKWMMGRKMLKLSCTHVRNAKKFHYSILPEDPQARKNLSSPSPAPDTTKASGKVEKQQQKRSRKGK